jgi:hypothetical protein
LLGAEHFCGGVWEPACGDGAMAEVLAAAGLDVFATDLIDRGYGEGGVNFLDQLALPVPNIVTNPPYRAAERFVCHALELAPAKLALLLRLAWLEGEGRRRRVFSAIPPARVHVLSARPTLWDGSDPNPRETGGAMAYAWFVWDRAHTGPTVLDWLA